MMVSYEIAKRLKEAGFPQPTETHLGGVWYTSDYYACALVWFREASVGVDKLNDAIFAPSATDILQYLPGWAMQYVEAEWICYYVQNELEDFVGHSNPAEAAADAWFFDNKYKE